MLENMVSKIYILFIYQKLMQQKIKTKRMGTTSMSDFFKYKIETDKRLKK